MTVSSPARGDDALNTADVITAVASIATAVFTGLLAWFGLLRLQASQTEPVLQVDEWRIDGKRKIVGGQDDVLDGKWNVGFAVAEAAGAPARLKRIVARVSGEGGSVTTLRPQTFDTRTVSAHVPYKATVSMDTLRTEGSAYLEVDVHFSGLRTKDQGTMAKFSAVITRSREPPGGPYTVRIEAAE